MPDIISDFLKPRSVRVQPESSTRARIIIEPFERGFGHTLGNALRRILLSSMPGAAVTEVEIEAVLHEYTAIDGVQEDVVEILLNSQALWMAAAAAQRSTCCSSNSSGALPPEEAPRPSRCRMPSIRPKAAPICASSASI